MVLLLLYLLFWAKIWIGKKSMGTIREVSRLLTRPNIFIFSNNASYLCYPLGPDTPHPTHKCFSWFANQSFLVNAHRKEKKTHHFIFHNPKDYDIDLGPRKSFLHIKSIRPLTKPRKQANANEPQSGHSSPLRPLSAGKWLCFHREEN